MTTTNTAPAQPAAPQLNDAERQIIERIKQVTASRHSKLQRVVLDLAKGNITGIFGFPGW